MRMVLTNENTFTVSRIGSAVEADKKINLALQICVIVHALAAARQTAQRRPADVRGHGLYLASRLSMARSASDLWTVEFSLYSVAALVAGRTLGQVVACAGRRRTRQAEISGCQPYLGASRREQPCWWPATSSYWTHQRWFKHQTECVGRSSGTRGRFELGSGATGGCHRRPSGVAPQVARHDHGGRQGLRQRRVSKGVAALGQSRVHPTALQSAHGCQLASRSLPKAAQGRELFPASETLPSSGNAL